MALFAGASMLWRFPYQPTAYDDDWEDQPSQGPFFQWGLGVALPMLIAGWGIFAIVTRQSSWSGERGISMTLQGTNAMASGVAAISAAIFLHCHYFWGNVFDQAWFAVFGKIAGAAGFIVGIGIVIARCASC